ncbi:MAG: tetratricopeptide repeat protein [Alphaproteobacteria bacterium]|nr:tetratricopeptide repeat protein [Alphaproteobacteria bacterium]
MPNKSSKLLHIILALFFTGLLSSCGGGDSFNPNYDENNMPPERRVNGELAFSSPSLMKMAESFRIAGDYTNAIRLYQRAANESPEHVPSRLALGQIYQRLGAMDGAITYYRQVLDLDPDNTEAQLGLGQMMVQNNQPAEAIDFLEKAASKSPDNYRIYNSIGLAYDLQGLHDQAQQAYGRGLSKKPDNISLLNNLALSLAFQDEFAPSIKLLSKAVNLDYSQTTAQQNLIMVYALSGEEDAARTMAKSFMTPEEIETNMYRYNWLRGLSSKRRAQAVFLNLNSFPDEEEETTETGLTEPEPTMTQPVVSMDPKRKMLEEILNSENQGGEGVATTNEAPTTIEAPTIPENEPRAAEMESVMETPTMPDNDPEEMPPVQNMSSVNSSLYHLQLGSYPTEEAANIDWRRLQILAPDMLKGQDIDIKSIMTAENKQRFRLYFGQYDNFRAAQENCQMLQNQQVPCLVMKAANPSN